MSIVNLNLPDLLDFQNLLYSDLPNYLDPGPPRQGGQEGLNGTGYPGGLGGSGSRGSPEDSGDNKK